MFSPLVKRGSRRGLTQKIEPFLEVVVTEAAGAGIRNFSFPVPHVSTCDRPSLHKRKSKGEKFKLCWVLCSNSVSYAGGLSTSEV